MKITSKLHAGHVWAFDCPNRNPDPKSRSFLWYLPSSPWLSQDTLAEQLLEQTAEEEEVPSIRKRRNPIKQPSESISTCTCSMMFQQIMMFTWPHPMTLWIRRTTSPRVLENRPHSLDTTDSPISLKAKRLAKLGINSVTVCG